jgi:predicted HNH restriction endonuclease
MEEKEKRYRVTAKLTHELQIIVQGKNAQEAQYSAEAIDFEKWNQMYFAWKIVDVSRDYFLQRVKVENNSKNDENDENDED